MKRVNVAGVVKLTQIDSGPSDDVVLITQLCGVCRDSKILVNTQLHIVCAEAGEEVAVAHSSSHSKKQQETVRTGVVGACMCVFSSTFIHLVEYLVEWNTGGMRECKGAYVCASACVQVCVCVMVHLPVRILVCHRGELKCELTVEVLETGDQHGYAALVSRL